ncbi:hypothetical protein K435DRAFT_851154 [Dendrothele bispora CBS 962.96]|uniref:Uncharacterized protein n=1 Tax=Dendrothele bispora (strain CBS 962.96) TaxID=1314807 RepID=A0A4S8MN72_DENBC|nr:hypothetical protein K435DRAFT_851154 [Dendrothele bispora CBS 962.96]
MFTHLMATRLLLIGGSKPPTASWLQTQGQQQHRGYGLSAFNVTVIPGNRTGTSLSSFSLLAINPSLQYAGHPHVHPHHCHCHYRQLILHHNIPAIHTFTLVVLIRSLIITMEQEEGKREET